MKIRMAFLAVAVLWAVSFAQPSVRAEQDGGKTVWDGVFTAEQAERGSVAYEEACGSCHGGDMAGDGFAPALSGGEFSGNWNSLSLGDLYDRIRISMPPTGPAEVPNAQKADILAYMLKFNRYPAGTVELEAKTEVLKLIKIEMKQ